MSNFPYLNEAVFSVVGALRKKAGYRQQKLAELSSMARVYLLQLEQGKFRPTLNPVFFLVDGLGLLSVALETKLETKNCLQGPFGPIPSQYKENGHMAAMVDSPLKTDAGF